MFIEMKKAVLLSAGRLFFVQNTEGAFFLFFFVALFVIQTEYE
jgi:hypothetical protein